MEQAVVGRRSALKVELIVKESQIPAAIEWEFVTEDGDLGFEIYLPPAEPDQQKLYAVQCGRLECDLRPCSGRALCQRAGSYVIKFDNGHSWTRAKRLSYYLEVAPAGGLLLSASASSATLPVRRGGPRARLRFIPPSDLPSPAPTRTPSSPMSVPVQGSNSAGARSPPPPSPPASTDSAASVSPSPPSPSNGGLVSFPGGGGSQESFHTACSHLSDSGGAGFY